MKLGIYVFTKLFIFIVLCLSVILTIKYFTQAKEIAKVKEKSVKKYSLANLTSIQQVMIDHDVSKEINRIINSLTKIKVIIFCSYLILVIYVLWSLFIW